MNIQKGFRTQKIFYRTELRVIYTQVEKDFESFLNVMAEVLADHKEEINRLRTQVQELSNEKQSQ